MRNGGGPGRNLLSPHIIHHMGEEEPGGETSLDLSAGRRFSTYFSHTYISSNKLPISKALLKYGYAEFRLEMIEYCEPKDVIQREQYYIDLLKPEYNILKVAVRF
jgi:group I intron endonuclease